MKETEIARAFFYAEQEALFYDDTIALTQPDYQRVHQTIVDLLRHHWLKHKPVEGTFLDIGCGTGEEALNILGAFPTLRGIAVDLSPKMLERASSRLHKMLGASWQDRCRVECLDITDQAVTAESLLDFLPDEEKEEGYGLVVSAFALHHYTYEQKESVYHKCFAVLQDGGGLLLNADLFSYQSPELAAAAQRVMEDWLNREFAGAPLDLRQKVGAHGVEWDLLLGAWLDHIRTYNIPLPIESSAAIEEKRAAGEGELRLLRSAGFREAACPYRYFQSGILWAKK